MFSLNSVKLGILRKWRVLLARETSDTRGQQSCEGLAASGDGSGLRSDEGGGEGPALAGSPRLLRAAGGHVRRVHPGRRRRPGESLSGW